MQVKAAKNRCFTFSHHHHVVFLLLFPCVSPCHQECDGKTGTSREQHIIYFIRQHRGGYHIVPAFTSLLYINKPDNISVI